MSLRVLHHTCLEQRGGATRVADLLGKALAPLGVQSLRNFELAETAKGARILEDRPWQDTLRREAEAGTIIHIHATKDWPTLFPLLKGTQSALAGRILITLHDCRLFTGGCPYPLDCPELAQGCPTCPRNFQETVAYRKAVADGLKAVSPLLVSPSGWMKKLAASALPDSKITVIPNGVEWPSRPPSRHEARKVIGIDPAARVALFVAHGADMAAYKGGSSWRDLWNDIRKSAPGSLCFIIGGEEHSQQDGLITLPYLDQAKLKLFMTAADLLLYPTLADNHPLIILEAMAAACPSISYATGGIPEQIMTGQDSQTGQLIPQGDRTTFIRNAALLLTNPAQTRAMGKEAFVHGQGRFGVERMGRGYVGVYERMG